MVNAPAGTITGVKIPAQQGGAGDKAAASAAVDGPAVEHFYSIPFLECERYGTPAMAAPRPAIDATEPRLYRPFSPAFRPPGLHIARPAGARAGDDLPVIAYVHGGNYDHGSPDNFRCTGHELAHQGVIVAAVGYRLAFEGFAHFSQEERHRYRGTDDAMVGLRWLYRNIESFGGDPTNITLVGQSAGAGVALWLSRRDHFQGHFRRVVAMSPAFPRRSFEQRKALVRAAAMFAVLREEFERRRQPAVERAFRRYKRLVFHDLCVGPAPFSAAELADIPVLVTHTADELFNDPAIAWVDGRGWLRRCAPRLSSLVGMNGSAADIAQYWDVAAQGRGAEHPVGRLMSDAVIRRFVRDVAERAPGRVWLGEYVSSSSHPAYHCVDLPLVFCQPDERPELFDAAVERLAATRAAREALQEELSATVVDFARGVQPAWPEYRPGRTERTWDLATGAVGSARDPLRAVGLAWPDPVG